MQMKNKSCELDTISTDKLKEIQDSYTDTITKIVNISLTNGEFCTQWKTAIVKPLLKKLGLELLQFVLLIQAGGKMHVGSTVRPLQH